MATRFTTKEEEQHQTDNDVQSYCENDGLWIRPTRANAANITRRRQHSHAPSSPSPRRRTGLHRASFSPETTPLFCFLSAALPGVLLPLSARQSCPGLDHNANPPKTRHWPDDGSVVDRQLPSHLPSLLAAELYQDHVAQVPLDLQHSLTIRRTTPYSSDTPTHQTSTKFVPAFWPPSNESPPTDDVLSGLDGSVVAPQAGERKG